MLMGLMQHEHPLTLHHVLDRMGRMYGNTEVVTAVEDGVERATFADVVARVSRLGHALSELGIERGDRIASFAWNSQRHLELYLGVPCYGAVLHTANIRLFAEQIVYTINHAKDRIVFVDDSLIELFAPIVDQLETVERYVVLGDGDASGLPDALRYEELLAAQPDTEFAWPELDDGEAAGLCYTSGTTGNPKGVLYSHKSNLLHSLGTCMVDNVGISSADRVMPIVPMFHANCWGLPYAAGVTGAALIFPSRFMVADRICDLITSEKVTVAGAVPTIWLDALRHADKNDPDLSSLRTVMCGGAAVPRSLMEAFQERHGVRIIQAWGMTEMSPVGSVAKPPAGVGGDDEWRFRDTAGRIVPLVEARLIGDDGEEVPWDGESVGELEVRGPWIAASYFEDDTAPEKFHDGWLRTGDIASLDSHGYLRISDRSKDVIKSGGEWISSVELEKELMAHPDVEEAAVIARPDERFTERPLACVVLTEGAAQDIDSLRSHLGDRVAKWWLPDAWAFIDAVPRTSVGKFDKKVLRKQLSDGELEVVETKAPEGAASA